MLSAFYPHDNAGMTPKPVMTGRRSWQRQQFKHRAPFSTTGNSRRMTVGKEPGVPISPLRIALIMLSMRTQRTSHKKP